MRPVTDLHAIILTLNEEKHLKRCIASIRDVCASITIIDSGSTDRTASIAHDFNAEVVVSPWVNYATQLNIGIAHVAGRGGWVLRIDADEYLPDECATNIKRTLAEMAPTTDGILVLRQIIFLGRRIRWGGIEPNWQLRIWRCDRGRCEHRWMDEHIIVDGAISRSEIRLIDQNLNPLDWWTNKHNHYASREAVDILATRGLLPSPIDALSQHNASPQAIIRRCLKEYVYNRLPGGARSLAYFIYRYVLRAGFLDGQAGYYFHALQGFWYRTLVDAKLMEILLIARSENISVVEAVLRATGINLCPSDEPRIEPTNDRVVRNFGVRLPSPPNGSKDLA